jgi:type IV pilus assembly protein PilA
MYKNTQTGFTLIELMIVVAILGILSAVAVPQYVLYTKRAKFTEVILATATFKSAAEASVQLGTSTVITDLNSGSKGIPDKVEASSSNKPVGEFVDSVDIVDGVITAVSTLKNRDGAAYKYVLRGTISNGSIVWRMDLDKSQSTCLVDSICSPI